MADPYLTQAPYTLLNGRKLEIAEGDLTPVEKTDMIELHETLGKLRRFAQDERISACLDKYENALMVTAFGDRHETSALNIYGVSEQAEEDLGQECHTSLNSKKFVERLSATREFADVASASVSAFNFNYLLAFHGPDMPPIAYALYEIKRVQKNLKVLDITPEVLKSLTYRDPFESYEGPKSLREILYWNFDLEPYAVQPLLGFALGSIYSDVTHPLDRARRSACRDFTFP